MKLLYLGHLDQKIDFIFLRNFYHQCTERASRSSAILCKDNSEVSTKTQVANLNLTCFSDIFSLLEQDDVLLIDLRSPDQNMQICFASPSPINNFKRSVSIVYNLERHSINAWYSCAEL